MIREPLRAFTLLEMLVVIAIIAIISAIALPTIRAFKPDPLKAASTQLLNDLAFARHRAMADHTTVYVCFMPPVNLLLNSAQAPTKLWQQDQQKLLKVQYIGYAMYEKRTVGDQPGASQPHWITGWRTLPDGTGFPAEMFYGNGVGVPPNPYTIGFGYYSFDYNAGGDIILNPETNSPSEFMTRFPTIAFDYRGALVPYLNGGWYSWTPPPTPDPPPAGVYYDNQRPGQTFDCVIPLTLGRSNVSTTNDWNANLTTPVTFTENPSGSYTSTYCHIVIDGPTGRARRDTEALR